MQIRHLLHRTASGDRPVQARILVALAVLTLAAVPARGQGRIPAEGCFQGRVLSGTLVDVQVLVGGQRASLYSAPGQVGRLYFEASHNQDYALRIHNRTNRRVAVLISVDGLNVVNGSRSGLSNREPMYVLDPRESATIRGWRTSLDDVQQFVFVDEDRSYATRTDQANSDMGWIRVLAFEEQSPVAWYSRPYEWERRDNAPRSGKAGSESAQPPAAEGGEAQDSRQKPAPDALLDGSKQKSESYPGTGWGRHRHDSVREVWFEPAALATDQLVLRYEYWSGLQALGIFPNHDRLAERERGDCYYALPPLW